MSRYPRFTSRKPLEPLDGDGNSVINLSYSRNKENRPVKEEHTDIAGFIHKKLATENLVKKPTFTSPKHDDVVKSQKSNKKIPIRRGLSSIEWGPKAKFSVFNDAQSSEIENLAGKKISEQKNDTEEKPSKLAFEKAKKFFEDQEKDPMYKNFGEVHITVRKNFQERKKSLRRSVSHDTGLAVTGQPIPTRRVMELKTEYERHFTDTPSYCFRIPPKLEKVKVQHKRGEVERQATIQLKDTCKLSRDVQYFSLYSEDLMIYYQEMETKRRAFDPDYSELNMTPSQRLIVVSYLIRNLYYSRYPSYISYQIVRLFDDMVRARPIRLPELQLVGLTAMWIVLKKDLIAYKCPSAEEIVLLSGGGYTKQDLIAAEMKLSISLGFEYSYPDPYSILNHCIISLDRSKMVDDFAIGIIFYYGCYVLDLVLFESRLLNISPLLLGATAAEIAVTLKMERDENLNEEKFEYWRSDFAKENFHPLEIFDTRCDLVRAITQSPKKEYPNHIVFKKYKHSRYGGISLELVCKITKLSPQIE